MLWLTAQILIKNERMAPKTRNYSDKYASQHEYSDFSTFYKFSDYNQDNTEVITYIEFRIKLSNNVCFETNSLLWSQYLLWNLN